jgi:hypothetical protein
MSRLRPILQLGSSSCATSVANVRLDIPSLLAASAIPTASSFSVPDMKIRFLSVTYCLLHADAATRTIVLSLRQKQLDFSIRTGSFLPFNSRFCPLIMPAGRPPKVDALTLLLIAQHLYGEFKAVQEGPGKRIRADRPEYEILMKNAESSSKLTAEKLAELEEEVDRQIRLGHLKAGDKESRFRDLREEIEFHRRFGDSNRSRILARKFVPVPGEPHVIDRLLNATTTEHIKKICARAFATYPEKVSEGLVAHVPRPNWPISNASLLPGTLSQHASEFIEAKSSPKFPKSDRPSSRSKQLWFLSRALAGALHGITSRTAVNLIGSVRPDEMPVVAKISKRRRRSKKKVRKHL